VPCDLHLDSLAPGNLSQESFEGRLGTWHNFRTIFQEIESKADVFGGMGSQCWRKGLLDLCLGEPVFLNAALRIDFGRSEGGIQESRVLFSFYGHSADLPILSRE
jgi:hypothetical protein